MQIRSINGLGGLALIIGPVVTVVAFLFQPGGMLIASAEASDAAGSIAASVENRALANFTSLLIAACLTLTLFGFHILLRGVRGGGIGRVSAHFGYLMLTVGVFGWILMQGLELGMTHETAQPATAIFAVQFSMGLIAGLAVALGFLLLSLGLPAQGRNGRPVALAIVVVSAIALVSQVVGISDPGLYDTMVTVTRACYFLWVAWSAFLGAQLLRQSEFGAAGEGD